MGDFIWKVASLPGRERAATAACKAVMLMGGRQETGRSPSKPSQSLSVKRNTDMVSKVCLPVLQSS